MTPLSPSVANVTRTVRDEAEVRKRLKVLLKAGLVTPETDEARGYRRALMWVLQIREIT